MVHRGSRGDRDRCHQPPTGSGTRWRVGAFARQGRQGRRRVGRHRAAGRDGHQRCRCADRPGARRRGVRRERSGTRRRRRAGLPAAPGGGHQRRVDVVDESGVSAVVFRPGLARPARGGRQVRRRVVLRFGHLSRLRLRSAGPAHDDAVEEHPHHHGQRGRAQRPLPGGRRDDGRNGLRPSAGFRTHAQDARLHRNGVEGTDTPDRQRTRG